MTNAIEKWKPILKKQMEKFELKYMVSEMKNSLYKFNSRLGTG